MDYDECLEFIHDFAWTDVEPGLERELELLDKMGNPHKGLKYIHIAGTNGKGSVAAMTASVLSKGGYKTGLFVSPHIIRFNERYSIDGEDIADEELTEIINYMRPYADTMAVHPTEFELMSAVGFEYFKRHDCDFVVLEVGLGGRMDCTNVIGPPVLAVITAIGLDHTEILGDTPSKIAGEKAGIIKRSSNCVLYDQGDDVKAVISKVCNENDVPLAISEDDAVCVVSAGLDGLEFDYKDIKGLRVPMAGTYQAKNAAVALKAFERLNELGYRISKEALREGLSSTKWGSRFELVSREPVFIVDGSHNPQGVKATVASLKHYFGGKKIIFLVGVMGEKDFEMMLSFILPLASELIAVQAEHQKRALSARKLAEAAGNDYCAVTSFEHLSDGIRHAMSKAGREDVICAIGSLYLSGDVKQELSKLDII